MQSNERAKANSQEVVEKRREKERKREEKELRKVAKAAGVKLATVTPVVNMLGTTQNPLGSVPTPGTEPTPLSLKKGEFGVGGWSTVNTSSSSGGFKKPGWTTVSAPPKPPSPPPPPPSEPHHITTILPPSSFRSGGWTTLEGLPSASTPNRPLTPNMHRAPPPPPEPIPAQNPPEPSTSGFKPIPVAEKPPQIQQQSGSRPGKNSSVGQRAESSRSGWQSFSRGGSRR